jgi:hypothetical protein
VFAYKLTGDESYLNKAFGCLEGFFANVDAAWVSDREPATNKVPFFCDACISSGDGFNFLAFNKGQLQYIYAIFENGGNPATVNIEAAENRHRLSPQPSLIVTPNPFYGVVTITPVCGILGGSFGIKVFDIKGNLLSDISNVPAKPARQITWDARNYAAGIYLVNMKMGMHEVSRRIYLLK